MIDSIENRCFFEDSKETNDVQTYFRASRGFFSVARMSAETEWDKRLASSSFLQRFHAHFE